MRKLVVLLPLALLIPAALAIAAGGSLDADTRQALLDALDDERRAHATYIAAADRYAGGPFARIAESETFHVSHLLALFEANGLEVPPDRWAERDIELPATLAEACAQAVAGERANVALYDRLLAEASEPDVRAVFTRLQGRSTDRHLPAFERCTAGGGADGGQGATMRRGSGIGQGAGMGQGMHGGMGQGGGKGRAACARAQTPDDAQPACACQRRCAAADPAPQPDSLR